MKSTDFRLAMLVVSLFFVPTVLAQSPASGNQGAVSPAQAVSATEVPRLIKFSGTLLDAQDRPLAGPVGVTFALHAQQSGGAALWMETQNVEPDARGNYTILLGANSAKGVPAELFASGEARWLEVQVERQAAQPRVLLVSVPYALKAGDAETLAGKPASAYALAGSGATMVAGTTGASAAPATSTGGTRLASTPQPAVACTSVTSDGTATVNSIALFKTACSIQSSVITQSGSNVGIGTAAPLFAVDVVGNNAGLRLSGTGTHQVTVTGASSGRLGQDVQGFFFASDTNGKVIKFLTNNGALNEWMRITSAGNVGIGTTAPAAKLEVNGTTKFDGLVSFAGGQTFPGTGTISGITTAAGSGLTGGGPSGTLNLGLLTSCAANEVLRWSGTAWACALAGTVTSVGSGLGLLGGPITATGTLAIDPLIVPRLGVANTFTGPLNTFAGITATTVTSTGALNNNFAGPLTAAQLNSTGALNNNFAGGITAKTLTSTGVLINTFAGPITATQLNSTGVGVNAFAGNITAPAFAGDGSALTNVNAGKLGALLPAAYAQLAAPNIFTNSNTFGIASFSGNTPSSTTVLVDQSASMAAGLTALVTGAQSTGVFAHSTDTTAPAPGTPLPVDAGVFGQSDNAVGFGVYGLGNSSTGSPAGVGGQSLSPQGSGVLGYNTSSGNASNFTPTAGDFGVQGVSFGPSGAGVFGHASDGGGTSAYGAIGVEGLADFNVKDTGTGVLGQGYFGGVVGASPSLLGGGNPITSLNSLVAANSSNGGLGFNPGVVGVGGVGIVGLAEGATVPNSAPLREDIGGVGVYGGGRQAGVWGETVSPGGTAGIFVNDTGSGFVLRLVGDSTGTEGFDVLDVTNTGALTAFDSMTIHGTLSASGKATFNAGVTTSSVTTGSIIGPVTISGGASIDNLNVTSSLTKPSGSFKIDHPLDPEHKILYHSFVESPDMKNVYDGVVTLDADGQAWVVLPAYFEALNKDFRYQLTAIGAPAPSLYVSQEIRGNRFQIMGGKPGGKISWQVTGTRQDAFAEKHRIQVEEEKPAAEQGFYLYPDAYGKPEEMGVAWARAHQAAPKPGAPKKEPEAPADKKK